MREIPLTQGKVALVDDADYEWLSQRKWHAHRNGSTWYAKRRDGEKPRQMHRDIMSAPDGMQVDHINGNGLDNRRANLRVCTHAENAHNYKRPCTNTSGYKGVSWNANAKKWGAKIKINGVLKHLGYFDDKIEAAKAYNNAAKQLFGEFARLNCV